MNLKKIKKDNSGLATILIVVIVVVIVVVAAGAAYVVLSNNGGEDKSKDVPALDDLAPGTVLRYDYFDGTSTYPFEIQYLGQNATDYFLKITVTLSPLLLSQTYELEPKAAPSGAKKIGQEERTTFEGKIKLDVWEYTVSGTAYKDYINPANGLSYYTEATKGTVTEKFTLKYHDVKRQTSYTPSNSVGKAYEYTGVDTAGLTYTSKLTMIADCTGGKFGIKMDGSFTPVYFLSNNLQGLPLEAVKDAAATPLAGTIDGTVMCEKWKFDLSNVEILFYVNASSHIIYGFVCTFSDGSIVTFDLSKKP